jgi:hypothetical protein
MTDADTPGRRRPGGQPKPKDQKRIAVNLRMSPSLHARLLSMAKEHGRSITQQAEMLLDDALRGDGEHLKGLENQIGQLNTEVRALVRGDPGQTIYRFASELRDDIGAMRLDIAAMRQDTLRRAEERLMAEDDPHDRENKDHDKAPTVASGPRIRRSRAQR